VAGSATGVGDVIVQGKGTLIKGERFRMAAGVEVRFPSGDVFNLLGSGAYGYKPFITVSRHGRFTPHVNVGYQWNGKSPLYQNNGVNLRLPDSIEYSAGADMGIVKHLTVVADLLGQHYINAPRVTPAVNTPGPGGSQVPSISIKNGDYEADNLALGLKANLWKNLLLTENILIKLNDGGLRSKVVPLVGLSYRF
jgi:hypothetical protein